MTPELAVNNHAGIAPRIRITSVHEHTIQASLTERFGWSLNWTRSRTFTLVEVRTDAGLTGWGEGSAAIELINEKPELVLGRSPFEKEAIYHELRAPSVMQRGKGAPLAPGLDIALWDLAGKALGIPCGLLFGPRYRTRVPVYLTALYRKDGNLEQLLADEALRWKAAGYRFMKAKIGYSPRQDYAVARAIREAIGDDVSLAVDSNCAYDAGTALALGRRLEPLDLMWWEEPLLAADLDGYRRLREAIGIPLAGGETSDADWLAANYIQPKLVDILQPDVELTGLTGARMLSWLCWVNHLRLVPHCWGTAIRTAATLQWMSAVPSLTPALHNCDILFEFDQTENPLRDAIVHDAPCFDATDGCVAVPAGPGLGISVIPEAVREYSIRSRSVV